MFALSFVPLGYEQIAVSTAVGLTVPTGANFAIISAETASLRWRDDGVAPTTTVGMPMADTDPPLNYSGALSKLQFVAQSGSPVLNVSYYRIAG